MDVIGHIKFVLFQVNSYQASVVTDGMDTYAIYTYLCGYLEWSGSGVDATVGYNLNGDYYMNHPLSGTGGIKDIACSGENRWKNVIYKLSFTIDETQQQRVQCMDLYARDVAIVGNLSRDGAEPCPCSYWQATVDGRYVWDWNYPNCFYQAFLLDPSSDAAQYCCYSFK